MSTSQKKGAKRPARAAKPATPSSQGHLMGSTVVGERGQLVIPKDIRDLANLKAGDKLMVVMHKNGPIMLLSIDQMQGMMRQMSEQMSVLLGS